MSLNRLEHLWRKLHGGFVTPRGDSAGTDELADGPVDFGDGPGPVRKRIRSMSSASIPNPDTAPHSTSTPLTDDRQTLHTSRQHTIFLAVDE